MSGPFDRGFAIYGLAFMVIGLIFVAYLAVTYEPVYPQRQRFELPADTGKRQQEPTIHHHYDKGRAP